MIDITHCHNQQPIYEIEDSDGNKQEVTEWNDPKDVIGPLNKPQYYDYWPVIFDIETSAELNQRPILCIIFDSLSKDLIVLADELRTEFNIRKDWVTEICHKYQFDEPENIVIDSCTQSAFERYTIKRIDDWNSKAKQRYDKNRKSLVAHNASFDIPMMGSPNDGLLDSPKIADKYEMAVRYKDISMVGHRAGQFGQIYQFFDHRINFKSLYVPVGDTMVACKAMWLPAGLTKVCEYMDIDIEATEVEEHGRLTKEYVDYAINDVIATYKLYFKLNERLKEMFGDLPVEHIYSTASIGKFVLRKMGYRRVGYEQEAVGRIATAYFGGRTDAMRTGEIIEDLQYTDILSQYPTVSKLTEVWDFMKCEYVTINQIEPDELPSIEDLSQPESWKQISDYYVKIQPHGATLPVRTPHLEDTTKVVTSKVHSEKDLTYHYMDILAAELIDNDTKFKIVAAWKVEANGEQKLTDYEIAGVNISKADNVMAKTIEARKNIQLEQGYKDETTLSLKIVANSLYGVSAERIVKEYKEDNEIVKHDVASKSGFYNPHVAATITAGGRLMLAYGQNIAESNGGDMVYCDTDSLILTDNVADIVIDGFNDLNPYGGKAGELDMLEKEKDEPGNLYCVGTKKYIFFNNKGEPLEVKEHGLGNYQNLRDYDTIVRLWQTIMHYDIDEMPLNCEPLYTKKMKEPVEWQFSASTREMRALLEKYTQEQVRYGDWLESTISFDNNIRYMAINLKDKQPEDWILKADIEGDTMVNVSQIKKKEIDTARLKLVEDIVNTFVIDAKDDDTIPTVNVTDLKIVTKEATSRQDIFVTSLKREFKRNMRVYQELIGKT